MANKIRQQIKSFAINKYNKRLLINSSVQNLGSEIYPKPRKRCLLSYVTPFIQYVNQSQVMKELKWNPDKIYPVLETLAQNYSNHTMFWESAEIVRQLIERGYVVDCIDAPKGAILTDVQQYNLIIDERNNLSKWTSLNPDAKTMYYSTGSHWTFNNFAELTRLNWLFCRRGFELETKRQITPTANAQYANAISSFGNKFIQSTYMDYCSKIIKLNISSVCSTPINLKKNWPKIRRNYIYFGSSGWVHRGLDLIIEAFLDNPNYNLSICGSDNGFYKVYGPEIEKTSNIKYVGFVNPLSEDFVKLAQDSIAFIYPTCSEGCSGAAIQCLQFGLIPLVTESAGLDISDIISPLSGSTDLSLIENIKYRVIELSNLEENELQRLSDLSWESSHNNHSRKSYSTSLKLLFDQFLI